MKYVMERTEWSCDYSIISAMTKPVNITNKHIVQIISRDSCIICNEVIDLLQNYELKNKNIELIIFDLEKGENPPKERNSFITPATWVNGELWYFGEIDINQFCIKLSKVNISQFDSNAICK
ncbi:MAG: hypothetical protein HOB40_06700 [Candidatus Marinimicrobia bacterium]|nr:hypothetical protein [Candidatus Neomarinimicrobiota bacterium]MBT3501349.1 hypothetical protein [Candidatus Neomarinimicrobiota bacterium]MBT3839079.1 hypothetical protein [Candidatus Neomarinimicrobiota bacterium]MBT4000202.1 hypothetical protein [Candidatus Neomarinimicrobiota bacterium]MBT4283577.1 hypothetical protein [Candidatus Neomarinimicrobiota bacterium]